jgi:hypothetical protein
LSNPNALPISLCLCPPSCQLKYIAIVRASFSIPLRRRFKSSILPHATLGEQKKTNPYLRFASLKQFFAAMGYR